MRAVVQRVKSARVEIEGTLAGAIGEGLLVFLGVGKSDTVHDADTLAHKITHLRIFNDGEGKMNRSLIDVGGSMLVVSQFTLFGDCRKGHRPSFSDAAPAQAANELYEYFVAQSRKQIPIVQTGLFQTMMAVHLVNDGPVTLWLDSGRAL